MKRYLLLGLYFLFISLQAQEIVFPAMTPVCTMDINGNGDVAQFGELKECGSGQVYNVATDFPGPATALSCPLGTTACRRVEKIICPIDETPCEALAAICSRPQLCLSTFWQEPQGIGEIISRNTETGIEFICVATGQSFLSLALAEAACVQQQTINGFDCPTTVEPERYLTQLQCQNQCKKTASCRVDNPMECPLGNFDCINETTGSESYSCSPNQCATFESSGVYDPVDTRPVPDDGIITEAEGCIDQIQIFNGNPESCRLPGIASGYKNCCLEADEDLLTDSQGSISESILWSSGIAAVADAAAASYAAYTSLGSSTSVGEAAAYSGEAFNTTLIEGLTSTTVIVAVVVAAITTYMENACPPGGVLTAIKKKADQCVLLGEKCTTKIMGNCVQKREVHCCFNSLMATLIQVGAREQLGMDFGTVDIPNCRGFTPQEFQSIDFSKIDLTQYYSELQYRAQGDIDNEISTIITDAADGI